MATRSRNSAITIVLYYSAVTRLHPSIPSQSENVSLLSTLTVLKKEILLLNSQTLLTFPCGPHHVYPSIRTRKAAFSNYRFNFIQNKT